MKQKNDDTHFLAKRVLGVAFAIAANYVTHCNNTNENIKIEEFNDKIEKV